MKKELKIMMYYICFVGMLMILLPTIYWFMNPELTQMQIFVKFWFYIPLSIVCGLYVLNFKRE